MIQKSNNDLASKEQTLAYKLLLPSVIFLFICAAYPFGQVFYTSFTDRIFATERKTAFVGFDNYKKLLSLTIKRLGPVESEPGEILYERPIDVLPRKPRRYKELFQFSILGQHFVIGATDPDFIESVYNTVAFTVASVFLETVFGLMIALLVNSNFKGKGMMRAVMLIPWAVITVVSARIWEFMFAPSRIGLFNMLLSHLGWGDGYTSFLTMDHLQLPALIAVDVWKTTPFMALIILAGLQLIPSDLYRAASIDGASKVRQFFSITLPLLKPSLAVALIFRTLDSLRVFDLFQVLLSRRRYSMATYNYEQLINYRNMGMASAIGVLIFLFIAFFAFIYIKLLKMDTE